jgi:hypothetical protein
MKALALEGQRFSRLLVIERRPRPETAKDTSARWLCRCDCGNEITTTGHALKGGKTKSCGCYKLEIMATSKLRHGMSNTKTHNIWRGILKRCQSEGCEAFKHYGGRGIKVCDRWQTFENFLADMGECPTGNYSVERKDCNGHYEPNNCIWLLRSKQSENTRRSLKFTINGETKCLSAFARERGLRVGLVYDRITKLGWSIEKALSGEPHAYGH